MLKRKDVLVETVVPGWVYITLSFRHKGNDFESIIRDWVLRLSRYPLSVEVKLYSMNNFISTVIGPVVVRIGHDS